MLDQLIVCIAHPCFVVAWITASSDESETGCTTTFNGTVFCGSIPENLGRQSLEEVIICGCVGVIVYVSVFSFGLFTCRQQQQFAAKKVKFFYAFVMIGSGLEVCEGHFCVAHRRAPSLSVVLFTFSFAWKLHAGVYGNGSNLVRGAVEHLVCVSHNEPANDVARVLHGSAVVEHNHLSTKEGPHILVHQHALRHNQQMHCLSEGNTCPKNDSMRFFFSIRVAFIFSNIRIGLVAQNERVQNWLYNRSYFPAPVALMTFSAYNHVWRKAIFMSSKCSYKYIWTKFKKSSLFNTVNNFITWQILITTLVVAIDVITTMGAVLVIIFDLFFMRGDFSVHRYLSDPSAIYVYRYLSDLGDLCLSIFVWSLGDLCPSIFVWPLRFMSIDICLIPQQFMSIQTNVYHTVWCLLKYKRISVEYVQ